MSAAAVQRPASRRALVARATSLLSLGVGVFGATLAWCGTLRVANGDASVVLSALVAVSLAYASTRVESLRGGAALALVASLALGGLIGLGAMGAPEGRPSTWFALGGALLWFVAASARAACATPLMALLYRGAPLATHDALDRAMLASALWLVASLTEALLVVWLMPRSYGGLAGPALGVATFALVLLSGLSALAALVRSLRWLARWRAVSRGEAFRVVDAAVWLQPVPEEPWFYDSAPLDGVLVRSVAREGVAYREGTLDVAHTRVPRDTSRIARRLAMRAALAAALLGTLVTLASTLGARLRW